MITKKTYIIVALSVKVTLLSPCWGFYSQ